MKLITSAILLLSFCQIAQAGDNSVLCIPDEGTVTLTISDSGQIEALTPDQSYVLDVTDSCLAKSTDYTLGIETSGNDLQICVGDSVLAIDPTYERTVDRCPIMGIEKLP